MTDLRTTRLNRTWLVKMLIFFVLLVGFGCWGLYDALVVYPGNGVADASFKLKNYLEAAAKDGKLYDRDVKIPDPRRELGELSARKQRLARRPAGGVGGGGGGGDKLSEFELARHAWLQSLERIWRLQATELPVYKVRRTIVAPSGEEVIGGVGAATQARQQEVAVFFHPHDATASSAPPSRSGPRSPESLDTVFRELVEYWKTAKAPKPLAFYDLPSQWLFVVVGYGGGLYLAAIIARSAVRKYRFDQSGHCLILPGGAEIRPGDVAEFDKRRWHKFFVTLRLRDGKSLKLDLLRHTPLEEWVLSMERIAFPDVALDSVEAPVPPPGGVGAASTHAAVGGHADMTYGGVYDGVYAMLFFDPTRGGAARDHAARRAQEDTIRSLALALQPDGGWRPWLTACAGPIGPSGPSTGASGPIDTIAHWLNDGDPRYKIDTSRLDPTFSLAARSRALGFEPYTVVLGRLTADAATRVHEKMTDPPADGYLGLAVLRVSPAQIDRISEPLGLESGLELKGAVCRGPWRLGDEALADAGLSREG